MSRSILVGLVMTALVAAGGDALAQRDAGAKARGEFGRGFYTPRPAVGGGYNAGPLYYQPTPAAESYRSFSYEPIAVEAGETVVVSPTEARVMVGRTQIGTLEAGREFQVTRVVNGWLGAIVEQDGRELRGWVWHQNVVPDDVAATPAAPPAPAANDAAPTQSYRTFSYEPTDVPAMSAPVQSRQPARRVTPPEARMRPGSRRY